MGASSIQLMMLHDFGNIAGLRHHQVWIQVVVDLQH